MSAMSDYLETKLLDHCFRFTSFASPSAVYLALFTSDPGQSGSAGEVSGNAYVRKQITFGASVAGVVKNSSTIVFDTATPAGWGTVAYFGIFDGVSGGNMLIHGSLTSSKAISSGDRIQFASGDISVQFN